MSTYQRERLAAETEAEREARLQQMSTYQRERLAAETEEEREVRLRCDRQRHRDQQLWFPSVHLDPQSLLGLPTLVATYSPMTPSSDHLTMMLEKVARLDLLIWLLQ